jgi:fumarylacetoacetate (FAA) hydrolase family protein
VINSVEQLLPTDATSAILVGRVFDPVVGGPCVVVIRDGFAIDISHHAPTTSTLFAKPDLAGFLKSIPVAGKSWALEELVDSMRDEMNPNLPRLLAPIDLQVVKAAGVTFVESMLERVIEERAQGDPARAQEIRGTLLAVIGGAISDVVPGSQEAKKVKEVLIAEGLWSQYLEVGIGPDPEIFTKAPVLAAVGCGQKIGVNNRSKWNNPEPELVMVVRPDGVAVGACLGNDVNLRDFEGRSALLLTEGKDNNASCALGPFVRVFDNDFTMDTVRQLELNLVVTGDDGFVLDGFSSMKNISRDPLDLIRHTVGTHHQYPDGFVLFTGTLFSPTKDRHEAGAGFTHDQGDIVRISTPQLGALVNEVTYSQEAAPWTFGIWSLMKNLASRQLLS